LCSACRGTAATTPDASAGATTLGAPGPVGASIAVVLGGSRVAVANADQGSVSFLDPDSLTVIGTTDVDFAGDPGDAEIAPDETDYLLRATNGCFARQIGPSDIVWSYSGVRPLFDDAAANASAVTRDYVLDVADHDGALPVLSVFGGKITTYRRLAEHALEKLVPYLPRLAPAWTAQAVLPGGDMPGANFEAYFSAFRGRHAFLPARLARRLARDYGTCAEAILGAATTLGDLGEDFGAGLTRAEVDYLIDQEWARTAHDILWRRSKLGLRLAAEQVDRLSLYLQGRNLVA